MLMHFHNIEFAQKPSSHGYSCQREEHDRKNTRQPRGVEEESLKVIHDIRVPVFPGQDYYHPEASQNTD